MKYILLILAAMVGGCATPGQIREYNKAMEQANRALSACQAYMDYSKIRLGVCDAITTSYQACLIEQGKSDPAFEKEADKAALETDAKFCKEAKEEWQRKAFCHKEQP